MTEVDNAASTDRQGAVMVYSAESFIARADECVRLAALSRDDLVRQELLQLRESYLQTAERLAKLVGDRPHAIR
jgi:hypothetical protein